MALNDFCKVNYSFNNLYCTPLQSSLLFHFIFLCCYYVFSEHRWCSLSFRTWWLKSRSWQPKERSYRQSWSTLRSAWHCRRLPGLGPTSRAIHPGDTLQDHQPPTRTVIHTPAKPPSPDYCCVHSKNLERDGWTENLACEVATRWTPWPQKTSKHIQLQGQPHIIT